MGQLKTNYVYDTVLYNKLYYTLIDKSIFGKTKGNSSISELYPYEDWQVVTRNLKTDSILKYKKLIGVYGCSFANAAEDIWIYLQYPNKVKFLETKNIHKLIRKVLKFMKRYPDEFTQLEQLKAIEQLTEILYLNASKHSNINININYL